MIDDVIYYNGYKHKPTQNGISSSRNLHAVLQELADLVQTATLDMIIGSTQDFADSSLYIT